jgi:eukaryotic-like serine/threonine-protein kinase
VWEPDAPAFMITWHGAMTYAAWLGRRTGRPYRLTGELEHEKASRGVDARAFPWGDFFDPTWACMRLSQDGLLRPVGVDQFPIDESPYGVRHLAGNVVEWCADPYLREGPALAGGVYVPPADPAEAAACERTLRGGCFLFDSFLLRAATRHNSPSIIRDVTLGFRLARSYPA